MIISSEGGKKKNSEANFNLMISYIIMMMTIHRNNCVEKVLGVVVFHTFADDCTKPKKKWRLQILLQREKTKKTVMCAKGRKVTPNKSALLSLYIYTSAVGYVKMVFRFFLSLSLWLVFQCSSASGAVWERVRVLTRQVVAESVVGNRTSTGSHVRSLSSVLCLLNSTFFLLFVCLIIQLNQLYRVNINLNFNCFVLKIERQNLGWCVCVCVVCSGGGTLKCLAGVINNNGIASGRKTMMALLLL